MDDDTFWTLAIWTIDLAVVIFLGLVISFFSIRVTGLAYRFASCVFRSVFCIALALVVLLGVYFYTTMLEQRSAHRAKLVETAPITGALLNVATNTTALLEHAQHLKKFARHFVADVNA